MQHTDLLTWFLHLLLITRLFLKIILKDCVLVIYHPNGGYCVESRFERDPTMGKVIESFIPYMEMSKTSFFMFYIVRDAYKEYGNDLHSYLFSDSNIGNANEIVNSSVESISVADDGPIDSFDEEAYLSSGIQQSVEHSNDATQASGSCRMFIGSTL